MVLRSRGRPAGLALILVLILGLAACAGSTPASQPAASLPASAPIDLAQPWRHIGPAAVGIDPAHLAAADVQASKLGFVRSLIVVQMGAIVDEHYFGGATAATQADLRSGTKSVMALLVGIATDQGSLSGPGERLDALLRPPVATLSGPKAAITVGDLLTMRSGFAWDETTKAGYNAWAVASNQVDDLLQRPLADSPGATFTYNSAAVHLLSVGISQATGGTTEAFARRVLFDPIGIGADTWETDNQGFNNGAAGLAIVPSDIARIGQLVLQRGASGSRQVVPAAWIGAMLSSQVAVGSQLGPLADLDYGELWWLGTVDGQAVAFAWGYRGQLLLIEPARDVVVVVTTALDDPSMDPDAEAAGAMDLIVNDVLAAAR